MIELDQAAKAARRAEQEILDQVNGRRRALGPWLTAHRADLVAILALAALAYIVAHLV
jgi:hypothetical protein